MKRSLASETTTDLCFPEDPEAFQIPRRQKSPPQPRGRLACGIKGGRESWGFKSQQL